MRCCSNEIHTRTCVTIDVMKNRIGFSGCQLFRATLNNKLMFEVAAIYVNCTLLAIGGNDDELRLSSILMTVRPHLVLVDSCLYHRSRMYIYIYSTKIIVARFIIQSLFLVDRQPGGLNDLQL